jgi:hypothetical protein
MQAVSRAAYVVVSSPDDEWPHGSHLLSVEVKRCLRFGYFPPGLRIKQLKTGDEYAVSGRELRKQELVRVM